MQALKKQPREAVRFRKTRVFLENLGSEALFETMLHDYKEQQDIVDTLPRLRLDKWVLYASCEQSLRQALPAAGVAQPARIFGTGKDWVKQQWTEKRQVMQIIITS